MADWKFKLNRVGGSEILKTYPDLKAMQEEVAQKQLAQARAQFVSDFGMEGNFKIEFVQNGIRMVYRVAAADAKTGAILKANPKWLDKVTRGISL